MANYNKTNSNKEKKYNDYETRLTEAYDLIERLEYRIVELENKVRNLEKFHSR